MKRRQVKKALKGMSRREKRRFAKEASRSRSPFRMVAIILLLALVVLFLLPYFF